VGQVTIEDLQGRTLGTRPVDLLKVRHHAQMGPAGSFRAGWSLPPLTQEAELAPTARGTVLLTYRDGAGRVFRRSKVYRDDQGGDTINSYGPSNYGK
jgi:hypothetical protein